MEMAFSKVFKVTGEGRLLFLEAVTIMTDQRVSPSNSVSALS